MHSSWVCTYLRLTVSGRRGPSWCRPPQEADLLWRQTPLKRQTPPYKADPREQTRVKTLPFRNLFAGGNYSGGYKRIRQGHPGPIRSIFELHAHFDETGQITAVHFTSHNKCLRFTSSATPADHLVSSMIEKSWETPLFPYLYEVWHNIA